MYLSDPERGVEQLAAASSTSFHCQCLSCKCALLNHARHTQSNIGVSKPIKVEKGTIRMQNIMVHNISNHWYIDPFWIYTTPIPKSWIHFWFDPRKSCNLGMRNVWPVITYLLKNTYSVLQKKCKLLNYICCNRSLLCSLKHIILSSMKKIIHSISAYKTMKGPYQI